MKRKDYYPSYIPRKWIHFAEHGRKYRIRKKYRNRILRTISSHAPAQHIGQMTIQLALATWNPGQHGSEMAVPEQDPQALGGVKYRREPSENFKRNLEGWRDVWSFTDKVLQAIENTEYIAGLRLVKENNIEYGPFTEDGALVSYYPYWFCWVQFTLEHGLARKIPADYEKLL